MKTESQDAQIEAVAEEKAAVVDEKQPVENGELNISDHEGQFLQKEKERDDADAKADIMAQEAAQE